jgi:hypothetical protein
MLAWPQSNLTVSTIVASILCGHLLALGVMAEVSNKKQWPTKVVEAFGANASVRRIPGLNPDARIKTHPLNVA